MGGIVMKKTVVLGISGGIAAFKAAQLTSDLVKKGYDVEVIMTENATQFIAPLTFASLTQHHVMVSTFENVFHRNVEHIAIAKKADLFVIVPASANVIAKIVHGIADDMLTTTFLAATCKKIICPAMNTNMYENPITQRNLAACRSLGYTIVEPEIGHLACGDSGKGKLANVQSILTCIDTSFHTSSLLCGKKVLVSAGPTQEALDPVRFISNHSSGKMGYAIACAARDMGANVTLVSGPVTLQAPHGVRLLSIRCAQEMFDTMKNEYSDQDFIIKAAAVSDYRAALIAQDKIKKQGDSMTLTLIKNPDILSYIGKHKKEGQVVCGFAMETQDVLENARKKRQSKQCDMIVVNNLKEDGAGFQHDTNIVTMIEQDHEEAFAIMNKYDIGVALLSRLFQIYKKKEEARAC